MRIRKCQVAVAGSPSGPPHRRLGISHAFVTSFRVFESYIGVSSNEGFDKLRRIVVLRQSLSPVASRFRPVFPYEKLRSGDIFRLFLIVRLSWRGFCKYIERSILWFAARTNAAFSRSRSRKANHRQADSPREE
jgi:hypothetical protein